MFTGIVEGIGEVQKIEGNRFTIRHDFNEPFEMGESIALSGMCGTVIEMQDDTFVVEIMKESRDRTTFGAAQVGTNVNLERAAQVGQRNSGHNVTGHIDQVGEILELERVDDYWRIRIGIDPANAKLVVEKGSVAVDGISLTVAGVNPPSVPPLSRGEGMSWFEVAIISHTWEVTTLHGRQVGDGVNVEFDILGKYVVKMSNDECRISK